MTTPDNDNDDVELELQREFAEQLDRMIGEFAQNCQFAGIKSADIVGIVSATLLYELVVAAQAVDFDEAKFTDWCQRNYRDIRDEIRKRMQ